MNTEEFKRRLTAILSADVEGYSRLMRNDEEATIRTLKTYRTEMSNLIQRYRGRVVDAPGDNIMAEFSSVVDAVNCAVEIQLDLAERNTELTPERKMLFRIGVNLGDIVENGERIYGDGVNIAARMEGLAEGGGICISGIVYDQVKNKLGLGYEYLGEQKVKNIADPVPAYRVLSFPGAAAHRVVKAKKAVGRIWRNMALVMAAMLVVGVAVAAWYFHFRSPPVEVASVEKMALPLPDKPSIAVLPFVNMSGDPEQEYLADGITEQIITTLSKIEDLFVIARNSTFTYKGKPVKVQQVSEDLGVRYVLEGSVQRTADQLRITAQFIDAITGHHLWADKYDRDLKDIFALQDEITKNILAALQVKLTEGEQALIFAKGTHSPEAYLKFSRGRELMHQNTRESNALARQLFEEAITLDPHYAAGYSMLSYTYIQGAWQGWSKGESPKESLARAEELVRKAIALDDSLFHGHGLLSMILALTRHYEKAIAEAERAVTLGPNFASSYACFGYILHIAGRNKEAIAATKNAIRLDPFPPAVYLHDLSLEYLFEGMYEDSIVTLKKAVHRDPDNLFTHLFLAANYSFLAREDEAGDEIVEVIRIDPTFSLDDYENTIVLHYKNKADAQRYIEALRKVWPK